MADVEEFMLRSRHSEDLYLALRAEPCNEFCDQYCDGPETLVELSQDGLSAAAVLPGYVGDARPLSTLLHEVDREWRGWVGTKVVGEPGKSWLAFTATNDGSGVVLLSVVLTNDPTWRSWSVESNLELDVGSVARHSAELDRWLAAVWPDDRPTPEP